MGASGWFLTSITILLIFNMLYFAINPQSTVDILFSTLMGFISSTLVLIIVGGVQILGSGLSGSSVRILFSSSMLLSFLYRISFTTFAGFPISRINIGLGLVNNFLVVFPTTILGGLPYMIGLMIGIIATGSGLILINSSGSGE